MQQRMGGMKLTVNGEVKLVEKTSLSVASLLDHEKVEMPEMVSVQLNGEFVRREDFANVAVNEGDQVDFLYFMGGGASR
jgi:sulfur carrier protein